MVNLWQFVFKFPPATHYNKIRVNPCYPWSKLKKGRKILRPYIPTRISVFFTKITM